MEILTFNCYLAYNLLQLRQFKSFDQTMTNFERSSYEPSVLPLWKHL